MLRRIVLTLFLAVGSWAAAGEDFPEPEILPPPVEALSASAGSASASVPVATGTSIPAIPPMASTPIMTTAVSPPRELDIPGVLLPEPAANESVHAEAVVTPIESPPAIARPRVPTGMTVRQLEPLFMLAKGSESAALEAKKSDDDVAYRDQLSKGVKAYMDIVNQADAGNEAREEAWYGVARCEYRLGNWWRTFEALERSYPKEYSKPDVESRVKLEMFAADRLYSLREAIAPDAVDEDKPLSGYMAAAKVYAAVAFNQPRNAQAPRAVLRGGDIAAFYGKWDEAERFYRQVVKNYGDTDEAMQARASLMEVLYRRDWPSGFPEEGRRDIRLMRDDLERAGSNNSELTKERLRRANSAGAEYEAEIKLNNAIDYMRSVRAGKKAQQAALFLLNDVIDKYPNTKAAADARRILDEGSGNRPAGQRSRAAPRQNEGNFSPYPAEPQGSAEVPPAPVPDAVERAIPGADVLDSLTPPVIPGQ